MGEPSFARACIGDEQLVATVEARGIGVLPRLLEPAHLERAREEFDRAYLTAGAGAGAPNTRVTLSGESLLGYPTLARLYVHPRILRIVASILNEPIPWLWMIRANRYVPPHPGVPKHSDGFEDELALPFTRVAVAIFLDDTGMESGALTYVPGSHHRHYEPESGAARSPPTHADIDAGDYSAVELAAGGALFRIPEVWHAVNPIHRLRRYVAASFTGRGRMSPAMLLRRQQTREERRTVASDSIPEEARPYWNWE